MFVSTTKQNHSEFKKEKFTSKMNFDTKFRFHYYPSLCEYITHATTHTHALLHGRNESPNIQMTGEDGMTNNLYFKTKELYLCNKIHKGAHNYELIVKHEPISNAIYNIYTCFLLQQNYSIMKEEGGGNVSGNNVLNEISSVPDNSFIENVDLSGFVKSSKETFSFYFTKEKNVDQPCIVIVFPTLFSVRFPREMETDEDGDVFAPFSFMRKNKNEGAFSIDEYSYLLSKSPAIQEGFTENGSTGQYYVDKDNNKMLCEISEENDDQALFAALPINSNSVDRYNISIFGNSIFAITSLFVGGIVVNCFQIILDERLNWGNWGGYNATTIIINFLFLILTLLFIINNFASNFMNFEDLNNGKYVMGVIIFWWIAYIIARSLFKTTLTGQQMERYMTSFRFLDVTEKLKSASDQLKGGGEEVRSIGEIRRSSI